MVMVVAKCVIVCALSWMGSTMSDEGMVSCPYYASSLLSSAISSEEVCCRCMEK